MNQTMWLQLCIYRFPSSGAVNKGNLKFPHFIFSMEMVGVIVRNADHIYITIINKSDFRILMSKRISKTIFRGGIKFQVSQALATCTDCTDLQTHNASNDM